MKKLYLIIIFILLIFSPKIYSQTETVYASYRYIMGDNDSKNKAKKICFQEAKRLCLEKAGTYIESITEIKNYRLTKDEIKSYSAATLKVEIVSEKTEHTGESMAISMTVKAVVNINSLKEGIREMKNKKRKLLGE